MATCSREEIVVILRQNLEEKDWPQEIVELTLLGTLVHECAFVGWAKSVREDLAQPIQDMIVGGEPYHHSWHIFKIDPASPQYRALQLQVLTSVIAVDSPHFSLDKDDLSMMLDLASSLANIDRTRTLEWVKYAWEAGQHQRRIHDMEVEGGVNNKIGIVANFAAYLSIFGEKKFLRVTIASPQSA